MQHVKVSRPAYSLSGYRGVHACKYKKCVLSQMLWCMPVVSETLEAQAGGLQVRGQPGKFSEALSQNKNIKRAGDVTW